MPTPIKTRATIERNREVGELRAWACGEGVRGGRSKDRDVGPVSRRRSTGSYFRDVLIRKMQANLGTALMTEGRCHGE